MAESADAEDSNSSVREGVRVRVPPRAPQAATVTVVRYISTVNRAGHKRGTVKEIPDDEAVALIDAGLIFPVDDLDDAGDRWFVPGVNLDKEF